MGAIMDERDAYGVAEFCRRHGISRGYLYSLWRRGQGPRFMQAGDRRFITPEAGADWRRELETASRAGDSSSKAA
jgi:transposase-like protein